MSHVGDGALHAYLDGALEEYPADEARGVREHLEACAECRERLEVERRVRGDAAAMLGLAAPEVEVPSFEELRAYVRRSAPGKGKISLQLYRLGWAASVVLALGTGWLLRGGQAPSAGLEDGRALQAPAEETVRGAPAAPSTPSSELRESATRADEVAQQGQPSPGEVVQNAASGIVADLDVAPESAEPPSAPAAAPDQPRAAGVSTTAAFGDAAPRPDVGVAEPETVRTEQVARAVDQVREVPNAAPSAEPSPAAVAGLGAARIDAGRRQRVVADDEADRAGPLPLTVPGLRTLEVVRLQDGAGFSGTRALQLLESGDTLEVLYLPEGTDPASLPPLGEGDNELRYRRGSEWLLLRSSAPLPRLEVLVQRIEPAR